MEGGRGEKENGGRYREYTSIAGRDTDQRTILSPRSYRSANITLNDHPLDINFRQVVRARTPAIPQIPGYVCFTYPRREDTLSDPGYLVSLSF